MKILSIDAWAGDEEGMWDWNAWYTVGEISKEEFETLDTDEKILEWACKDLITYADLCGVEDDQYNVLITDKSNGRPLYAFAYGEDLS